MKLDLKEEIKNCLLAGIGAAAISYEKASEIIEECIKKGTLTVEQGKVMNEELKHKASDAAKHVKEKLDEHITIIKTEDTPTKDSILDSMNSMSNEELEEILKKAEELRKNHESKETETSNESKE